MHKVMLVDDDYKVIQFLEKYIAWDSMNLQVTGSFKNGQQAYERSEIQMPEILITDIGMPFMDGIELIQKMKVLNPELQCIILSCHDEFHYAQQALKLKVNDYILKETLEVKPFEQLLKKIVSQLEGSKQIEEQIEKNKLTQLQHISLRKEKFIQVVWTSPIFLAEDWLRELEEFGCHLNKQSYTHVLCYLDHYRDVFERYQSDEMIKLIIGNVTKEILGAHSQVVFFQYSAKEMMLLFPDHGVNRPVTVSDMEGTLKQLNRSMKQYLKLSVSFLVGNSISTIKQFKEHTLILANQLDQRFYAEDGCIEIAIDFQGDTEDLFIYLEQAVKQFKEMLIEEKADDIKQQIHYWITHIKQAKYPSALVKDWILKLLMDIQLMFKNMQQFQSNYSLELMSGLILDSEKLDHLHKYMLIFFGDAMKLSEIIKNQSKRSEIFQASQYVERNLGRKITLEDVANVLHLHPNYFSKLFKHEKGINFNEYVTKKKIEEAKKLLIENNKSIKEVTDLLGFANQSYFIKVFKEYTGNTPYEYAKRNTSQN
jgi:two-component system response regulator YesN